MAFGILLLGILYILMGLFQFLWGMGASGVGGFSWLTGILFSQGMQDFGGSTFWGGIWGMAGGVFQLVVGVGLLMRQKWAYYLAWIGAILAVVGPLLALFTGNFWAIFALIIPGIVLWYLSADKDVKRTFRIGSYAQGAITKTPTTTPRP
jgi:hypothetical protein